MQYKVPQKIDLEDKIIGPLTLVQFMYLMAGGMIFYIAMNISTATLILIGLPVAVLALALAFLKIQDQPFSRFLLAMIMYVVRPKERFWQKDLAREQFSSEVSTFKKEEKKEEKFEARKVEKSQLEELARALDTKTWDEIEKSKVKRQKYNSKDI